MTTDDKTDLAIYIGRFQPVHNGHLALLHKALEVGRHVAVVIGSAHQARTPKNPFTWEERVEMLKLAVPEADRARLHFLPMRDYYDEARWKAAVDRAVARLGGELGLGNRPSVTLIGHFKDATSAYLNLFEGWRLESVDRVGTIDGVHIRDALFGSAGQDLDACLAALTTVAPPSTLAFLKAWSALPYYEELAREWQMLRRYKEAWKNAPYAPVLVTVDAVVRCAGKVLLIKRGQPPGVGQFAVPGGFIEQRETAYQSAVRELREETRFSLLDSTVRAALKGSAVFDHPDRSQRGRTITHAFYFDLGDSALPEISAADDAQSAQWVPIEEIGAIEDKFHDDHFHMLDHFLGLTREE